MANYRQRMIALKVRAARCALVGWLLALEVLPNVHLWKHQAATHSHRGETTTWVVRRSGDVAYDGDHDNDRGRKAHWHRDGVFHDPEPREPSRNHHGKGGKRGKGEAQLNQQWTHAVASQHLTDGIAHHACAFVPAPIILPWLGGVMVTDIARAVFAIETLGTRRGIDPSARGPPTLHG